VAAVPAGPAAGVRPDTAVVATLNGDPNGLKQEDLQRALDGAVGSLASCFKAGGPSNVGLSFDADPSGRPSGIKVSGASPETERCISNTLSGVRLPRFSGNAVPVQFPLSVHAPAPVAGATAPSSTGAAAPATAAPAAPPIFVKP
jgi:hypothetical protein